MRTEGERRKAPAPPKDDVGADAGTLFGWVLRGTAWRRVTLTGGTARTWTWAELRDWFAGPKEAIPPGADPNSWKRERCPAWSPATFNGPRSGANVGPAGALALDLDSDPGSPEGSRARGIPDLPPAALCAAFAVALPGVAWLAHTTPKSRPGAWRWRVVVPLSRPVAGAEHAEACGFVRSALLPHCAAPEADTGWAEPHRCAFVPARTEHYAHAEGVGGPLDIGRVLADAPEGGWWSHAEEQAEHRWPPTHMAAATLAAARAAAPAPQSGDSRERRYGLAVLRGACDRVVRAQPGGRHKAIYAAARCVGGYADACGLGESEIVGALLRAAAAAGVGDDRMAELRRTIGDGIGSGRAAPLTLPPPREHPREATMPDDDAPPADSSAVGGDGVFARGDDVELGPLLVEDLGGVGGVVADEDSLWAWSGRAWEQRSDAAVRNIAAGYAGRWVRAGGVGKVRPLALSQSSLRRIVDRAKDLRDSPGWFAGAPAGVAFRRGVLHLEDDGRVTWREHEPRARQKAAWLRDYDPAEPNGEGTNTWPRFVADTWANAEDIGERAALLQEWMGAALFGLAPRYKLALLLVGAADTGKSTLLSVVEALFPVGSRTSVGAQSMASEYYRAALAGSLLNVVNELPARELLDAEAAKAILSGDPVEARHPAGRPFTLRCRAAHIFAANELPRALDRALLRRLAVLTCDNPRPQERQDARLRARLLAELPYIAWWAVEGAQTLVRRGHYILPASARTAATEWIQDSDSAAGFAAECLSAEAATGHTSIKSVYARYRQWCEAAGHRPLAASELSKRLRACGFRPGPRRGDGNTLQCELLQ